MYFAQQQISTIYFLRKYACWDLNQLPLISLYVYDFGVTSLGKQNNLFHFQRLIEHTRTYKRLKNESDNDNKYFWQNVLLLLVVQLLHVILISFEFFDCANKNTMFSMHITASFSTMHHKFLISLLLTWNRLWIGTQKTIHHLLIQLTWPYCFYTVGRFYHFIPETKL